MGRKRISGNEPPWIYSDTANAIVKYERCIEACHFISLDVAMSCCTIFKMHDLHSVCFVNTDLRSLTIKCIKYPCYKCLSCESKMASILYLKVGSVVGCPLNCPLLQYLKVVGYPLSCPLSCPLYPYMAVVGSLICWQNSHGQPTPLPTELPTFSCVEVVGCPLSCPLFPWMEVVGSLICMAQFPWAAHGQPTPLPTELPTFFIVRSSGLPTELPTELPTVSIYGSSGQPNWHGKIPMGSPRAAHSVAHVQPMDSPWAAPLFIPYGQSYRSGVGPVLSVVSVVGSEIGWGLVVQSEDWSAGRMGVGLEERDLSIGVIGRQPGYSACWSGIITLFNQSG